MHDDGDWAGMTAIAHEDTRVSKGAAHDGWSNDCSHAGAHSNYSSLMKIMHENDATVGSVTSLQVMAISKDDTRVTWVMCIWIMPLIMDAAFIVAMQVHL